MQNVADPGATYSVGDILSVIVGGLGGAAAWYAIIGYHAVRRDPALRGLSKLVLPLIVVSGALTVVLAATLDIELWFFSFSSHLIIGALGYSIGEYKGTLDMKQAIERALRQRLVSEGSESRSHEAPTRRRELSPGGGEP